MKESHIVGKTSSNDWKWPNTGLTSTEGVDEYKGKLHRAAQLGEGKTHAEADRVNWPRAGEKE